MALTINIKTLLRPSVILMVLLLILIPFTVCAVASDLLTVGENTLPTAKPHIVAGGDHDYPPYEYIDEHGQPAGFNVEVMRAIAEVMGWDVTFKLGPWDEVRRDLATGKIDVLPMYSSKERFDVVDFTNPFEMIYYEIFVRRDSKPVLSLDEIRGLEVIVQRDALMHDHLKPNNRGALLVLVESEPDALRLLASGIHDCAIVSRIGGLYAIDRLKLKNLATSGKPLLPRGYALAVKKGNIQLRDQLNQGLSILKNTGQHAEISRKWFGEMEPPRITFWSVLRYAVWIVVPLALLAVAALIWVKMLKKKVTQETKKLSIEMGERKRAEEEFEKIFILSADMICIADIKGYFRKINPAFGKTLGYTEKELLDRPFVDFVHPDDRENTLAIISEKLSKGIAVFYFENRYQCKDGSYRWLSWTSNPVPEEGITYAIAKDVTERRKAEEALKESETRWKELFNQSRSSIAIYAAINDGDDFIFKDFNPAGQKIDQVKREEIIGRRVTEVFPSVEEFGLLDVLRRVWKTGNPEHHDISFYKDNRIEGWRENYVYRLDTGEIVVIYDDITERKKAEKELEKHQQHLEKLVQERTANLEEKTHELEQSQQALQYLLEDVNEAKKELEKANERLQELDRLKSMFIASMSHELRTPLNSIIGFTSIILQGMTGEINEEQRDQLQRVLKGGKHLLFLITDVIDISKIEAGKIEIYAEEFRLDELLNEAVSNLKLQIRDKGLAIEVSVEPKEITLNTDRKRLFQCVLNYLSNAVKFTELGSVRVAARRIEAKKIRSYEDQIKTENKKQISTSQLLNF